MKKKIAEVRDTKGRLKDLKPAAPPAKKKPVGPVTLSVTVNESNGHEGEKDFSVGELVEFAVEPPDADVFFEDGQGSPVQRFDKKGKVFVRYARPGAYEARAFAKWEEVFVVNEVVTVTIREPKSE